MIGAPFVAPSVKLIEIELPDPVTLVIVGAAGASAGVTCTASDCKLLPFAFTAINLTEYVWLFVREDTTIGFDVDDVQLVPSSVEYR